VLLIRSANLFKSICYDNKFDIKLKGFNNGKKSMNKRMNIKSIMIFFSFLLPLIFFITSISAADALSPSSLFVNEIEEGELGKKIDRYLRQITPFGFSGALLVAKDGKIVINKGYGIAIRSENIPNTSETVFSTGSITKQFTAAGIMKLEMQGKLSTDDPITKFFEKVSEEKKAITIHHLLTHTSGVINYTGMDYEKAKRDETARKTLDAPLLFKPGERFEYSNAGFSLLAAVIEKVSGKGYEEYLYEHLFEPAGMKFTGYRLPKWEKKVVAHWYVGEKDNGIPLEKPYPCWNLLGNGGILSTTENMYKWHLALKGDKILSAEAKKKIFTPFLNDYGYGWDVLETERGILIQHNGGSMLGNSAEVRRYIDADVVTILFCNQSFGGRALIWPIRDKIEILAFGGDVVVPPSVIAIDTEKLRKFEGTYSLSRTGHLKAGIENGKLTIKAEGQEAINALFFPGKDALGFFKDLNKLSVSVFEGALKGDYEPFESILKDKERRKGPVRDLIEMRIRRYKEKTGEIKEVKAFGTLPSDFGGADTVMTQVQLKGEKGSIFFCLYWRDKMNVGVGPLMGSQQISVPFLLMSGTEFAGYHLSMAKNIRLSFDVDSGGVVTGLTIHNSGGDLSAKKIK
jgi:CubicO group peptidase (beta-lactamase class C family)